MRRPHAVGSKRSFLAAVGLLILMALPISRALAGETPATSSYPTKGTNEFGLWVGGAPDSSKLIGTIEDRQLLLVGLRYGRVLGAWESVTLEYTLDLFPAAVVFEPSEVRRGRSTIYGAGVSPLGFKLNFAPQSWIQPFVATSVGFLYFQDDIPVPDSSRFNFTPEFGVGVQFFLAPNRAITVGYRLHHMSNAGTSRNNPGMDSHVIYAGFSFLTP